MKAPTTYCLLLLLILLPVWLGAQIDDLEFKVYGFEDGLSHRNVFKIQQAPDGYLWIATISGLNRFDGGTFLNYSSQSPDLPLLDDYLTDMLIDSLGKLWLAHMTKSERKKCLSAVEISNSTPVDGSKMDTELEEILSNGYSVNLGDNEPDIAAVSVPVFGQEERIFLTLSVFGMLSRFDETFVERARAELNTVANQISQRLD